MLRMDWQERHLLYARMVATKPHRFVKFLAECFCPGDLVAGTATGSNAPPVIVMNDRLKKSPAKTGKRYRQTKISELFFNKRFRQSNIYEIF